MAAPESRRFGKPGDGDRPKIKLSSPAPAPSVPKAKTTRRIPRTTRRAVAEDGGDNNAAIVAQAKEEVRAKNQLVLIASIGGGGFLLLLIIAIAVASSSSGPVRESGRRPAKKAAAEPEPPPPPPRKAYNYVRNTGAIVFVCGGSEKHPDREVVLSACPKCPTRNGFAWDEAASGYRCSSCKGVYENAAIKCDQCGRAPRVTHLKKSGAAQGP